MFETKNPIITTASAPTPVMKNTQVQAVTQIKDAAVIKKENFIDGYGRLWGSVLVVLLLVGVVALLLGYYFFVFRFDNKIAKLESSFSSQQQLVDELEKWKANITILEAEKDKFETMVPAEKDLSKVLIRLEQLAQKYNLVFNSIENKTSDFMATTDGPFRTQAYTVVLSGGDYFTMKKFLTDIESSLRVVAPKSLIYSPDVNVFTLTFEIYHL